MDKRPTLLFINGPVGVGKSTIAQKYANNHKLALVLGADEFVGAMGQWLQNEGEAQDLALEYIKLVAEKHLKTGHDVVVPYHLSTPSEADEIKEAALAAGANFFECVLIAPKDEVIERALERGTWGEPGSPPMTEEDRPILEDLYRSFETALRARPDAVYIDVKKGDIEGTYKKLIDVLSQSHDA